MLGYVTYPAETIWGITHIPHPKMNLGMTCVPLKESD